jgi:hypothetical protein
MPARTSPERNGGSSARASPVNPFTPPAWTDLISDFIRFADVGFGNVPVSPPESHLGGDWIRASRSPDRVIDQVPRSPAREKQGQ